VGEEDKKKNDERLEKKIEIESARMLKICSHEDNPAFLVRGHP
jgi:hypothetical protein